MNDTDPVDVVDTDNDNVNFNQEDFEAFKVKVNNKRSKRIEINIKRIYTL